MSWKARMQKVCDDLERVEPARQKAVEEIAACIEAGRAHQLRTGGATIGVSVPNASAFLFGLDGDQDFPEALKDLRADLAELAEMAGDTSTGDTGHRSDVEAIAAQITERVMASVNEKLEALTAKA